MGEYEIVEENKCYIPDKADEPCRYYNSISERQCKRANIGFCQSKDPKTDCVKKRNGEDLCSDDYQVN